MEIVPNTAIEAAKNNVQATSDQIQEVNDFIRHNIFTHTNRVIMRHKFSGLTRDIEVKLIFSHTVGALNSDDRVELLKAVRDFEDFPEGDDPYGEHDFGAINFRGIKYFFKFDYYDESYDYGETNGNRVLTIMEAGDY